MPDAGASESLARTISDHRLIAELGEIALRQGAVEELLQIAVGRAAQALNLPFAKILVPDAAGESLLIVAGVGWKPGVVGHAGLPLDMRSPPGRTYLMGESTVIPDIRTEPGYDWSPLLRDHGVVSLINVPIQAAGEQFGVLEVDASAPIDGIEHACSFLSAFAVLLASAIRQKRLEEQIRVVSDERALMLREMQHRVQNNLAMIIAMLQIAQRSLPEQSARDTLRTIADRVAAIGVAHGQLFPDQSPGLIDIGGYLSSLCRSIGASRSEMSIETALDRIWMPIERGVPIGLIVNELCTNAAKHAFDHGEGRLSVTLAREAGNLARLIIQDHGRGMTEEAGAESGSGLRLVRALVGQIRAQMERTSRPGEGTRYDIRIPIEG